ncbi:antithrombin-iii-like isoform 2 protein [Lasius niger]|uniref:Antithrombin-iii-like isoform 2 protein n=1 Tax=Lasius niger TaxID=67767 RepID=A0A0J7K5C7_LASNI|nr:antithrombin-iii-like isoform 2 protein [Lasius niger]
MHVMEFPYTNENRSLLVFLPGSIILSDSMFRKCFKADDVICDLIERLLTEEGICKLRNLLDSDTPSENVIDFSTGPIFELERNMPMRELLRDLGIEELLKPDAINLDSFFVDDDSAHLGNVVHRICVKVTKRTLSRVQLT